MRTPASEEKLIFWHRAETSHLVVSNVLHNYYEKELGCFYDASWSLVESLMEMNVEETTNRRLPTTAPKKAESDRRNRK